MSMGLRDLSFSKLPPTQLYSFNQEGAVKDQT